jgi:hypothetical protein
MLKELKSQHRNIIQMAFNGYKNNEIAERLGMAPSSVSIILRQPLSQAYLNGLQDRAKEATLDVRKKLLSLNKSALDTFEHLLNSASRKAVPASVQFNAAKDVLDRNGYKAPDRLNIDMTLQTKTDEELDAEIAAIEASINKRYPGAKVNNLPEAKDQPVFNAPLLVTDSASDHEATSLSPDDDESEQPLEDYFDFNNESVFEELTGLEEQPSFEDPTLIEGLPVDLFRTGRS